MKKATFARAVAWSLTVAAGLFLLALAVGCATPAQKVLRSVNDYEFYTARYAEACPAAPKCPEKAAVLREWSKALDEAGAALKRGGDFPLQLERLQAVEKGMPK